MEYNKPGLANLKVQIGRIDNDNEEISWKEDLDYLGLLEILAIPEIPYIKNVTPYFGFATREKAEENNAVAGLNVKPLDDVYIKLEYLTDSEYDIMDKIDLQFGYLF